MADFNITIEGLDETIAMLEQAPRNVVARGFLRAAQAGTSVIADELERNTPIKEEDTGGKLDKGELRESVMIDTELDSQFRGVSSDVGFGKNGYVAYWLEYGHRIVGHKPNKKDTGKEVAAKPFVRQSADASAEAAIDAFTESLKETVHSEYSQSTAA